MEEDFEVKESGSFFDFKGFLIKILSFWPLFLLTLAVSYAYAYYTNVRKLSVYRMENSITIQDDQNPLFTGSTSLIFNWGGTTDKVQTNMVLFKSRTHAEKVVSYLQFYVTYLEMGKYQYEDVYGYTPFKLMLNDSVPQLFSKTMVFKTLENEQIELHIPFSGGNMSVNNYKKDILKTVLAPKESIKLTLKVGDTIDLPFLKAVLDASDVPHVSGKEYLVRLGHFNGSVKRYQGINIIQNPRGSSILELSKTGTNKRRLIDYLNASVYVRKRNQLERKNLFATNTIKFIDSSLTGRNEDLQEVMDELNAFKNNNLDVALKGGSKTLSEKLKTYDRSKEAEEQKLSYYDRIEDYLRTRKDYKNVPAPTVAGIDEGSINSGVSKIIALSVERSEMRYTAKEGNPAFNELDRRIDAEKTVLLENIRSSKENINQAIRDINTDIAKAESELRRFPKEEQELANLERQFTLSQGAYNLYLSKKSEANLLKAANVSDIIFIDRAKDVGNGPIGPNKRLNYMIATVVGGAIPLVLVFLLVFFNTKIGSPDEIKTLSQIPVLGVVGKSPYKNNLVVKEYSKSSIAESFRGIRSSLQFIYKKKNLDGAKTVLVTSSVSGEGKTFTSINIASVFALSEKKTVIVGLDLRKPKIFDDFELSNELGVVNYLIGQASLKDITQTSGIPYLDIVLAGPIPPNPSELLISDQMGELMAELKKEYDYIILDTPPVGLVADALELMQYADANLYMIRQGYTKKGMLALVNEKYRNGEITNVSFVLNYFRTKGRYGYGYGYGYGNYGNGYHDQYTKPNRFLRRLKRIFKK